MGRYTTLAGLIVPHTTMSISGAAKITVHEFRFVEGGSTEDHGRGLYTFRFTCSFSRDPSYSPPLYPDTFFGLKRLYDTRAVDFLDLEDIGRVPGRITNWDSTHDAALDGGSVAQFDFLEQEGHRFLAASRKPKSTASLQVAGDNWKLQVEAQRPPPNEGPLKLDVEPRVNRAFDLFDQVTGMIDVMLGARDQALLYSELVSSKLLSLIAKCNEAKHAFWLDDPMNWVMRNALYDVIMAAQNLTKTPDEESSTPKRYTVQQLSTVSQVSQAIYGTSSRAGDLLGLNNFADATAIRAGTKVVYIPAAA